MSRTMNYLRSAGVASLITVMALGSASPATSHPGSATHVDELSASVAGGSISVSGSATFVDGPVTLGTDPAGDAVPPGVGADLTKATVTAVIGAQGASLTLTAFVADPPAPPNPARERVTYQWLLSHPGVDSMCLLQAWQTVQALAPWFEVRSCPLPLPVVSTRSELIAGSIASDRVEWKLPSTQVAPGDTLTTSVLRAGAAATNPNSNSGSHSLFLLPFDELSAQAAYTVPTPTVSLGIAPAGTPPGDVPMTGAATVSSYGTFQGSVSAQGLAPGAYELVAKACYGQGPCALSSASLTV